MIKPHHDVRNGDDCSDADHLHRELSNHSQGFTGDAVHLHRELSYHI